MMLQQRTPLPAMPADRRSRLRPRRVAIGLIVLCAALVAAPPASPARAAKIRHFAAEHYAIRTALSRDETKVLARHMDRVFEAYQKKFSSMGVRITRQGPLALHLFRTQEQYVRFMAKQDIDAANSGGMFFTRPRIQGMATFTQGRSAAETRAVLQHEGCHQFVFQYFGSNLPVWVNEGLAQYFEDGIFVSGKLKLDMANGRRIESVKAALREDRAVDFERMLAIDQAEWHAALKRDHAEAALLYDQAWSMVFFLATAEDGRYVKPFREYLKGVSRGQNSRKAFRKAFNVPDMSALERKWRQYALAVQPDAINVVVARLTFLGEAMRFLDEKGMAIPRTLGDLRRTLRKMRFRLVRSSHGLTTEYSARDNTLYEYPVGRQGKRRFQLLGRARDDLPPRITAQGMKPEPTLVWSRDPDGKLVQDVVFK